LNDAREYIELLFSAHVRENLVQNINPLSAVEIKAVNARGLEANKFLAFSFNRVMDAGAVRHLLVTMQDISPRMALERQLEAERDRAHKEFSSLVQALKTDSGALRQFVGRAEAQLLQVNDLLRSASTATGKADIRKVIDNVFRLIHSFKGEASALNLELLAELANQFEDELDVLRNAPQITGDALLNLPLPLDNLLEKITVFRQLANAQAPVPEDASATDPLTRLTALAHKVALDLGKQIKTRLVLDNHATPWRCCTAPNSTALRFNWCAMRSPTALNCPRSAWRRASRQWACWCCNSAKKTPVRLNCACAMMVVV
jgi:HPt (histidine-containing phosphotransfer) domain-containing protein